ncbi:MAG: hypothetical protein IPM82_19490 [Saprospiraceae bacterium]|nr:hypothetical protein [Saprospiraceae bacterium]
MCVYFVILEEELRRHEGSHAGTARMTSQVAFGNDKRGLCVTLRFAFGYDKAAHTLDVAGCLRQ